MCRASPRFKAACPSCTRAPAWAPSASPAVRRPSLTSRSRWPAHRPSRSSRHVSYILAADTGGTFTDLAAYEKGSGRMVYTKSLTTYDDLVRGVMDCIRKARIALSDVDL